jgi:hypothetical protein
MQESSPAVAPAFQLPDTRGIVHTLDELLRHGALLLAFHRGTW